NEHLKGMALDEAYLYEHSPISDDQLAGFHGDGRGENEADGYNQKQPGPIEITPRSEHGDRHNDDEGKKSADHRPTQSDPMDVGLVKRTFIGLQSRRRISAQVLLRQRWWRITRRELLEARKRRPLRRAVNERLVGKRDRASAEPACQFGLGIRAEFAAIVANHELHAED